jgi:hypothetical protein
MDTLAYLAGRLELPVGYFLDENPTLLPNQTLMEQLRQAKGKAVLELLEEYKVPDPVYDPERWLLEALTCLELAREVLEEKPGYARQLLERAAEAGGNTPYYTPELERSRMLLCMRAGMPVDVSLLPSLDEELLLRAQSALKDGMKQRCLQLLEAAEDREAPLWNLLRGQLYLESKEYAGAAQCFRKAEVEFPQRCAEQLEVCYRELGDFRQAYYYACKRRE